MHFFEKTPFRTPLLLETLSGCAMAPNRRGHGSPKRVFKGFLGGSWGVLGGFLGVPSGPWTPLESSEVPGLRLAAPKSLPGAAWETPGSHRGRRKGFTGTSLEPSGRLPGAFGASQKPHGSIPGASPGALKSILGVARRFQDLSTSADGKGMPIELS